MILFRYTKTDGAEYISHLDLLRHLGRTFTRAGIKVGYSQGYHPHKLIYMSAPIGVGMKSLSEYCLVETDEDEKTFKEKFNAVSPKGITCLGAWYTPKKVGVASDISKAEYLITGVAPFDEKQFLSIESFTITTKDGKEKEVRNLIYDLKFTAEGLRCVLGFGNGLRAEKFAEKLVDIYGGKEIGIVKEEGMTQDGVVFENTVR